MKRYNLLFCCCCLILIHIISCKKDSNTTTPIVVADTTQPVIRLIDPASNKNFILGSLLHLQLDLSDNVELKSYKVTIAKSLKGVQTSDWAFSQTWQITASKKAFTVNHSEIIVPLIVTGNQTSTGNYDLGLTCSDTSGNEISTSITITLIKT